MLSIMLIIKKMPGIQLIRFHNNLLKKNWGHHVFNSQIYCCRFSYATDPRSVVVYRIRNLFQPGRFYSPGRIHTSYAHTVHTSAFLLGMTAVYKIIVIPQLLLHVPEDRNARQARVVTRALIATIFSNTFRGRICLSIDL